MTTKPCVLVAEDDPEMRDVLDDCLTALGYRVVAVEDGIEAMQYMSNTFGAITNEQAPDLLITDVRMPRCEGIDVLAYTKLWQVPVVVVTAFPTLDTVVEAKRLGAVACFSKPLDLHELLEVVRKHAPQPQPA